ncbi:MAG TPA: hypothetical protein VKU62_09010 [Thermoanaerobaculia bacterium]|nr:hypothetical protein [Thermoanaerobaculia bacterium]
MSNDKFYDRLREDAARLRFEPHDDALWTRLSARIRARVAAEPTVAQMLARWLRPVAATFAMLAIVATIGLTWIERREAASATELMASANSVEISVDGDTYSLGQ